MREGVPKRHRSCVQARGAGMGGHDFTTIMALSFCPVQPSRFYGVRLSTLITHYVKEKILSLFSHAEEVKPIMDSTIQLL